MIERHVKKFVEAYDQANRDVDACFESLQALKLRYGLTHMDIAAIVSDHVDSVTSDEVLRDLKVIDKEKGDDGIA